MKTSILMLSAAALLVASAAHAAPSAAQRFAETTESAAQSRLAEAGVDIAGRPIILKASVGGDRRLSSVKVLKSTGSRDLDDQAAKALRHLKLAEVPVEAVGRDITIVIDASSAQQFAGARP